MSILLQGIATIGSMDPNIINEHYKLEILAKFNEARLANPNIKSNELAHMIGTSDSTLKRIRRDLAIKSPYRYDIPIKNKSKKKDENEDTKPERGRKNKIQPEELVKRERSKSVKKDYGVSDFMSSLSSEKNSDISTDQQTHSLLERVVKNL